MVKTKISRIAAGCFVVALAAAPAASASGEPRSQAEREDIELVASEYGIRVDEAIVRFAWQDAFASAATGLAEAYPDVYVQGETNSEDPAIATVRFTGEVPAGAEEHVAPFRDRVEVRLVGGEELSRVEIDDAIFRAHRAVHETSQTAVSAATYDRASGAVRVTSVPADESLRDASEKQLRVQAAEIVVSLPDVGIDVELTLDPDMQPAAFE